MPEEDITPTPEPEPEPNPNPETGDMSPMIIFLIAACTYIITQLFIVKR